MERPNDVGDAKKGGHHLNCTCFVTDTMCTLPSGTEELSVKPVLPMTLASFGNTISCSVHVFTTD